MQMEKQMSSQEYQDICKRLDEINKRLSAKEKKLSEVWLTNEELMALLQVSRRTVQHYRDSNMLAVSCIGNRLYYRMSDVEDMLNRHYRKRLV